VLTGSEPCADTVSDGARSTPTWLPPVAAVDAASAIVSTGAEAVTVVDFERSTADADCDSDDTARVAVPLAECGVGASDGCPDAAEASTFGSSSQSLAAGTV